MPEREPDTELAIRDLHVSYGAVRVLQGVDLQVRAGEIAAIVGPNGAGKTTTLRAVSGLVPRTGEILLGGRPLSTRPDMVASSGVVHVPEGRGLMSSLTVRQNLRFGAAAVRRKFGDDELTMVGEFFPAVLRLLDRRAGSLSGGEQQMVAIGRGLLAKPTILMVDELSLGLAPRIVTEVLGRLVEAAAEQKIGILLVDQNVRALAEICDRTYVLSDGRATVVDAGNEEFVRAIYLGNDVDVPTKRG